MKHLWLAAAFVASAFALGCSDSASKSTAAPADAGPDADPFTLGDELDVDVPATGRAYVKLGAPPQVVTITGDPKASNGWDLAFEGLDVFTNSGVSGNGQCSAFGPLDSVVFLDNAAPEVPFLITDKTGGAFIRWYAYDGSAHALFSRFHVFGVKDGARLFKVQILGYYADRDGAPVSALYGLRYAEVTSAGSSPTQELQALDGTAGGPSAPLDSPSECLDLTNGARVMLTPAAARASTAWDLCFRRENISVNGEQGGPRGVGAIDLSADQTGTETLTTIQARTADTEKARFDAVDGAALATQSYRGDRIVSAFSDLWIAKGSNPPAPRKDAWYVVAADGKAKYLLGFARFQGANDKTPGTVVMRVKAVH
jgi:hypothetical protein